MDAAHDDLAVTQSPTRVFDELRVHSYPGGRDRFTPALERCEAASLLLVHVRADGILERHQRQLTLPAGTLCFLPNDAIVTFTGHEAGGIVLVELPRQVAIRCRDRLTGAAQLVISSETGAPALLRSFLDTLDQQLPGYRPDHPSWVQTCLCEMAERVLTECAAPAPTPTERALAAAKVFIRSHLADIDLTPEIVAHEAAVSVRTLNRLFAAEGSSVGGWIRRERLERCRADLLDPGKSACSISQIAAMWGFFDPAHFSRVFKDAHGASPRAYRTRDHLVVA